MSVITASSPDFPIAGAVGSPPAPGARHNEGHGRRLTAAFEALEAFPMLAESRTRVLALFTDREPSPDEVVAVVEADVALAINVLRLANQVRGPHRGQVDSAVQAVKVLSPSTVRAIAESAATYDFFERTPLWQGIPQRFRVHAVATQRAADHLARTSLPGARDRLLVGALLHDIGKLVLIHAYPGYPRQVHGDARTPEERLARERLELGVDHAVVGGVLARRWGLAPSLASLIERHHADDDGEAALIRLADMLAHHSLGGSVASGRLLMAARAVGVDTAQLRAVMYELPLAGAGARPRLVMPCPLSTRETELLRRLAAGMVYKQIAHELGLATSTVRTHLHNIYQKLGARDRAQAVLIATERGWI